MNSEDFIIRYLKNNLEASAVNQHFHEEFHKAFGGKKKETYFGAEPVQKAQTLLAQMAKRGILIKRKIALGSNWQPGFPKWVYSYSLTELFKSSGA